jgi:predicted HicB family RNase H-like nuclease
MKPYKGYLAGLYLDEGEAIIRGKVLNTRDTITFCGKTVGEALQAFRDSIDDYLDFCKEAGVEPDKPFSGKLLIRIKPEYHRDLSLIAQEEGRSINSLVAQLVTKAIRARKPLTHPTSVRPSEDQRSSSEESTERPVLRATPRSRQSSPSPGGRRRAKAK